MNMLQCNFGAPLRSQISFCQCTLFKPTSQILESFHTTSLFSAILKKKNPKTKTCEIWSDCYRELCYRQLEMGSNMHSSVCRSVKRVLHRYRPPMEEQKLGRRRLVTGLRHHAKDGVVAANAGTMLVVIGLRVAHLVEFGL